jgi:hypothetical protein
MPSLNIMVIATLVGFVHVSRTLAQAIEPEHVWCGTTSRSSPDTALLYVLNDPANANLADCEILLNDDTVWNEK